MKRPVIQAETSIITYKQTLFTHLAWERAQICTFWHEKAGIFHSKHVNFVQKLGKLVVTMLTLKNLNIPAEIFSFLTISCSHTYLFVSILQRQSLCLERHLFECQVFFFSLGRLAWLWLLRVMNQPKITWRPWLDDAFSAENAIYFLRVTNEVTDIFQKSRTLWPDPREYFCHRGCVTGAWFTTESSWDPSACPALIT